MPQLEGSGPRNQPSGAELGSSNAGRVAAMAAAVAWRVQCGEQAQEGPWAGLLASGSFCGLPPASDPYSILVQLYRSACCAVSSVDRPPAGCQPGLRMTA
jgi:hypothetical protein